MQIGDRAEDAATDALPGPLEKRVSTALSQEAAVGVKWKDMTKAMAAYGVRQTDIATVLGVSVPTMYRHLRYELDAGATLSNSKVAESIYQMATRAPYATRFQAARWWLACRADRREVQQIEIYRPVSEMSREEIAARLQIELDAEQSLTIGSGWGGSGSNVVPMRRRRPARAR